MFAKPKRIENEEVLQKRREERCWVCYRPAPSDPAHIKSVGSGGPDYDWNVVGLCRQHHTEQHKIGWTTFIKRYPAMGSKLYALGWYIAGAKLRNDKITCE